MLEKKVGKKCIGADKNNYVQEVFGGIDYRGDHSVRFHELLSGHRVYTRFPIYMQRT